MGGIDAFVNGEMESLWEAATTARFLDAIRDGSLPDEALDRWLVQDRIFASELFRFQSVTAAKAPEAARRTLLGGLLALDAELMWFDGLAGQRGLEPAAPHEVCARYTDFLLRSAYEEPYPRLVQILFAVEVCYLEAWSALAAAGPAPEGFHGTLIARWSSDEFRAYVDALKALVAADPCEDDAGFRRVLELERDFWRMTWEG